MKEKIYLTKAQIEHIQQQAKNPIWKMGILSAFTKNWFDVLAVSPNNLIHFSGNTDTGWQHIRERHEFYSDINYFGNGKIGNPSKFSKSSIPIFDYVQVADDVFTTGEKEVKPHPDSDMFDKFKGQSNRYTGSDGTPKTFFLVLYKGTRIVHSVYPSDNLKGKPPKRVLKDFARCRDKIIAVKTLIDDFYTITIPYENKEKVIRYVIVIRMNENTLLCKVFVQVNTLHGVPFYTIFPELAIFKANFKLLNPLGIGDIEFTRFLNGLGYADFAKIEEIIFKVEESIR